MQTECLYLTVDGVGALATKELTAPAPGDPHMHDGRRYTVRYVVPAKSGVGDRLVVATEDPVPA